MPLAAVIARSLDAAEELAFWTAVRETNASISQDERESALPDATIGDGLTDAADDTLTSEDSW